MWVQDLIDLSLRLLVDSILLLCIAEAADHVVHCWEIVVAFPLGPQADLITMMFNLGLVPQRRLDLTATFKKSPVNVTTIYMINQNKSALMENYHFFFFLHSLYRI